MVVMKKIPCFKCGKNTLQPFKEEDKVTGYCFNPDCGTYYSNIDKPEEYVEIEDTNYDLELFEQAKRAMFDGTFGWNERRIPASTDEHYGVTCKNGFRYYPRTKKGELSSIKIRNLTKKDFRSTGDAKGIDPFGWTQAMQSSRKKLFITEGEEDALALFTALMDYSKGSQWENTKPAVISLNNGASSARSDLNRLQSELENKFEEIVLVFDNDEAGQKGVSEALKVLPSAKVVKLPLKDSSEMLMAGNSRDLATSCLFKSSKVKPGTIKTADDLWDDIMKRPEWGLSWPWETLTELTYGVRLKEIYGFGGATGGGKTEGFKEIIEHFLFQHQKKVGVIFLEEANAKTFKVIAGKHVNKKLHVPDCKYTDDELRDAVNQIKDKVVIYDHDGDKDWENIKSTIRWMVNEGYQYIFLDHLTAVIAGEADETKALNKIMSEMATIVHQLNCTIFYISHLSTPQGTPHEEGGRVKASHFRGSRAIAYWSNYMFGYERNQQAVDEEMRHITRFRVIKDREYGFANGETFDLKYDHDTGRWPEHKGV